MCMKGDERVFYCEEALWNARHVPRGTHKHGYACVRIYSPPAHDPHALPANLRVLICPTGFGSQGARGEENL
jgi:hypothetical protein